MSEQENKKIDKKVLLLSFGIIALLLVFLVIVGLTGKADTLLFPSGMGFFLALYWVVVDVVPIIWKKEFEGKTDAQKRAYYVYAAIDAVGLGGLVYFVIDMSSATGAFVYAASILLKRRFRDEYHGIEADNEEADEAGAEDADSDPAGTKADEDGSSDLAGMEATRDRSSEAADTEADEDGSSDLTGMEAIRDRDSEAEGTEADEDGSSDPAGAEADQDA